MTPEKLKEIKDNFSCNENDKKLLLTYIEELEHKITNDYVSKSEHIKFCSELQESICQDYEQEIINLKEEISRLNVIIEGMVK